MKYIASYRTSQQISPDDWETVTRVLAIYDNTTIAQICEWFYKAEGVSDARKPNVKISFQVTQVDQQEN